MHGSIVQICIMNRYPLPLLSSPPPLDLQSSMETAELDLLVLEFWGMCVQALFQNGQFYSLQIVLQQRSDCQTEHLHLVSDDMIVEKVKTKSNKREGSLLASLSQIY